MEPKDHLESEMRAFMHSSVLIALAELDLATTILRNGNSQSAGQLAQLNACDPRGIAALLDSVAALGYLAKTGQGESAAYSVKPEYMELLDSESPRSFIPIIRHMGSIQRKWDQLAKSVKSGEPRPAVASVLGAEEDRVSFIMGMNSVAMDRRDKVMDNLATANAMPAKDAKILDVGGASGTYSEAFMDRLTDSTVTIFDLPVGVAQAKKRFGANKRVKLVSGDFMIDPLPPGHDYAWVSAIIHQLSREESRDLYKKAHQALNSGGMIAIRDYIMDPQGLAPVEGALFGVNMLVCTPHGRVYRFDEIKEDLEAAGFGEVKLAVEDPGMSGVVTARKMN